MKERYVRGILFGFCLVLIFSFISYIAFAAETASKTKITLRAYGGNMTIHGYYVEPTSSRVDLKLVEKDGVCNALMQISAHAQNSERKVIFTARMRSKDYCTIEDDNFYLEGSATFNFKSIPKYFKYPQVLPSGKITWLKKYLSEPEMLSDITGVEITKTGNYINIESPSFSLKQFDVIDFALEHK